MTSAAAGAWFYFGSPNDGSIAMERLIQKEVRFWLHFNHIVDWSDATPVPQASQPRRGGCSHAECPFKQRQVLKIASQISITIARCHIVHAESCEERRRVSQTETRRCSRATGYSAEARPMRQDFGDTIAELPLHQDSSQSSRPSRIIPSDQACQV